MGYRGFAGDLRLLAGASAKGRRSPHKPRGPALQVHSI